jgi:hypothetical protein
MGVTGYIVGQWKTKPGKNLQQAEFGTVGKRIFKRVICESSPEIPLEGKKLQTNVCSHVVTVQYVNMKNGM